MTIPTGGKDIRGNAFNARDHWKNKDFFDQGDDEVAVIYFPGSKKENKIIRQTIVDEIISLHYDAIEALDRGRYKDYKVILSRIRNEGILKSEDPL